MNEQPNFDQIYSEIMMIFITHKLKLDVIYFSLIQLLCSYSKVVNVNIDRIKNDIEMIFKTLPPPIEDSDDNPDQQSDSARAK